MKYGVLIILAASMLFATITLAEESDGWRLNHEDMALFLLEDTTRQPNFVRPPFKPIRTDAWHLKILEYFSSMEYGIQRKAYLPEQGVAPQRKSLVTRFQLFNKPIYLTFSLSQ
jgi:hypothetical protein